VRSRTLSADVLVVGGGIAGLAAAHALSRKVSVIVLESGSKPGGKVLTEARDGYTFDLGPSQFSRRAPATMEILQELGLDQHLAVASAAAREVHVVRDDRVLRVPLSPAGAVTTRLLSTRAKLRVLAEPLLAGRPPGEETVHGFAARHFGREFADVVAAAVAVGATASDIHDISLDAAFPMIRQLESRAGRGGLLGAALKAARAGRPAGESRDRTPPLGSFSPGGLGMISAALAQALGDSIRCGWRVRHIGRGEKYRYRVSADSDEAFESDQVIVALPAYAMAEVLADLAPAAAAAARRIPFVPVRVLGLGYRADDLPAPVSGSGVLSPLRPGRRVFGIAPVSNVFPGHAPPGHLLLRLFAGGQHDPAMVGLPRDQAVDAVRADLRDLLGISAPPSFVAEAVWPQGIPQYRPGHLELVRGIESALAECPGLFLTGSSLHGAGLDRTIQHARSIAEQVLGDEARHDRRHVNEGRLSGGPAGIHDDQHVP
jgi:protoporphyrinogen/coproporphyrinogen III oxidase